jgi:hypothetical protein
LLDTIVYFDRLLSGDASAVNGARGPARTRHVSVANGLPLTGGQE